MHRMLRSVFVAGLLAALMASVVPAAHAAGDGPPSVRTSGFEVPYGWAGPIQFDFSNAAPDEYHVDLSCENEGVNGGWMDVIVTDGPPPEGQSWDMYNWHISPLYGPDTCTVTVMDSTFTPVAEGAFTVAGAPPPPPPTMHIDNVSVSASTFYPLVRDGYLDGTTLRYRLSERARQLQILVRNRAGKVVRGGRMGPEDAGLQRWRWDGRDSYGRLVAAGTYRVTVRATGPVDTDKVTRSVRVATVTNRHTATKERLGNRGRAATRGACGVSCDSTAGTAILDCWGGRYAQMTYRFTVPATAAGITARIRGALNDADLCCHGRISKTWSRPNRTTVVLRARVTRMRAYDVRRAVVNYAYTTTL